MANEEEFRDRTKGKKNRKTLNIDFARSLSSGEVNTILQHELMRARAAMPSATEVTLPTEIVHDIKFRLSYYAKLFGEVDRKKLFEDGQAGEGNGSKDS